MRPNPLRNSACPSLVSFVDQQTTTATLTNNNNNNNNVGKNITFYGKSLESKIKLPKCSNSKIANCAILCKRTIQDERIVFAKLKNLTIFRNVQEIKE